MTSGAPERGFGIVGTGVIAAMHAAAIATLPRARLAAVTDVADGAAAAFAAARGCAAEPGLDQLLARPDVDVVCVCVPSGLHAEVGVRAARAGKHLVVEKPIDVTLAAADRLIEAARAAGVALTVISQHRFDPGLIELKRLLGDGALGRLVLAEASTKWYRTQAYYDSAAWRGTWAMDGGSLMNQGIHYVDLLRWCMGPVTEVTAVCATQAHQVEVEDTALAIVRFGSGAVGTILSSTAAYPRFPAAAGDHRDGRHRDRRGRPDRPPRVRRAGRQPAIPGRRRPGRRGGRGRGHGAAADPAAIEVASHAAQIADLLAAVEEGRAARRGRPGRPRRARDRPRRVRVGAHRRAGRAHGFMTVTLSGFADEISPDPREQLATLAAESITHLELRSAWSVSVADLTGAQLAEFRAMLADAGVAVSAIGSPIGKIPVGAPIGPELDRMRRVAATARELGTTIVRVFSFFIPAGEPPGRYRAQVIDRMAALAEIAAGQGLVLAHENEKEIFGDTPGRCTDLITSVASPALRATFDAANFVQCGVRPFSEAYGPLRPHLVYLQVKDALAATGEVVPAGQGDGQMRETLAALRDSGFAGVMSLEPHLARAGRHGGFSGPEGFTLAARSLKLILNELGISWR